MHDLHMPDALGVGFVAHNHTQNQEKNGLYNSVYSKHNTPLSGDRMTFDKAKYDNQYRKDHYNVINIRLPKDSNLKAQIQELAERENISVNQWILRAIKERLAWYE